MDTKVSPQVLGELCSIERSGSIQERKGEKAQAKQGRRRAAPIINREYVPDTRRMVEALNILLNASDVSSQSEEERG